MKNWGNTNLWNRTRSNEQIGVCTIQTLSDSLRKGANCPAFFARILLYTQQPARAKFSNAPCIAILWKCYLLCRTTPLVFHTSLLGSLHHDPQNRVFRIFLSRFGKLINWAQLLALLSVRRFLVFWLTFFHLMAAALCEFVKLCPFQPVNIVKRCYLPSSFLTEKERFLISPQIKDSNTAIVPYQVLGWTCNFP